MTERGERRGARGEPARGVTGGGERGGGDSARGATADRGAGRLAVVAPATGQPLGSVPRADAAAVADAVSVAARVQPLWAAVPVTARTAVLRRAAQAVLDELGTLAGLLAGETGRPRTEALLAELLPAVSGLHAVADAAPRDLADRRIGRRAARVAGRRAALVPAPVGVVGLCGGDASPWAEPLLDAAAAIVAGNAVVLAPAARLAGDRMGTIFARAGAPEELVTVLHGADLGAAGCDLVRTVGAGFGKGTMLVLGGAPASQVVAGALWAGFAGGGRHPAAVGRVVAVPGLAGDVADELAAAARRLRLGDPLDPDTEVGPLPSAEEVAAVEAAVAAAEAEGAERLCGGPADAPGLSGAFFAPVVLRGVRPGSAILRDPPAGPVLAVVEAEDESEAVALADETSAAVSVWTADRARGERIARRLRAELTWVNEHGHAAAAPQVRLARHVSVRRLASQPRGLRSARWLPYDPSLVDARVAVARLAHGRESERWDALRMGAAPLARTLARLARTRRG